MLVSRLMIRVWSNPGEFLARKLQVAPEGGVDARLIEMRRARARQDLIDAAPHHPHRNAFIDVEAITSRRSAALRHHGHHAARLDAAPEPVGGTWCQRDAARSSFHSSSANRMSKSSAGTPES